MDGIKPDLAKLNRICTENDRKVEELIEQYANTLAYHFIEAIEQAHKDGKSSLTMTVEGLVKEASNRGGPGYFTLKIANFSGSHHLARPVMKRVHSLLLPATEGTDYTLNICSAGNSISGVYIGEITWKRCR